MTETLRGQQFPPFAVTPRRGEGAYPKARGEIDTLREGTLAPSPKDFREARTETSGPPLRKVMSPGIGAIQGVS